MDDDLMSLRSTRSDNDNDLFGSFTDPDDLGFDLSTPASSPADSDSFDFGDPFGLPEFGQPASARAAAVAQPAAPQSAPTPAKAKGGKKPKRRARRSQRGFLGMTPQQRMVLSIFLFLDVAAMGLLILVALEKISF
jgi:hypothetical protein